MTSDLNLNLDLTLTRVIRAPRKAVWRAWTAPDQFAQWFLPAPTVCRVDRFEARPGGAIVTSMSDDGITFVPHMDACFLVVDEGERIVFTNVLDSSWRPVAGFPVAMSAEIVLSDHPDGTDYRVVVRHGDAVAKSQHEDLGFHDGWGSVTAQLAALVEA